MTALDARIGGYARVIRESHFVSDGDKDRRHEKLIGGLIDRDDRRTRRAIDKARKEREVFKVRIANRVECGLMCFRDVRPGSILRRRLFDLVRSFDLFGE